MNIETKATISIGMNGRLFPNNWRPALAEIAFARKHGFQAIQFGGLERGIDDAHLGAPIEDVAAALSDANMSAVMEIMVWITAEGVTEIGATPLDLLRANLPAIAGLRCSCVHWHLVPAKEQTGWVTEDAMRAIEFGLISQCHEAVALADQYGFRFGIEHNEPSVRPFPAPERCAALLEAVSGLHLIWDFNHTPDVQQAGYRTLIPRMSMLHVSDSPLPETNHHLPLGRGNVNFTSNLHALRDGGFHGPAILEIGGTPKSGGFGKDTDEALVQSQELLGMCIRSVVEG